MFPRTRLRELRKAAGLTQVELAEQTGVSQPTISDLENDRLSMSLAWTRTFSRVLNCAPADLLADEDNPDRLSEEERELIHKFREASGAQRELIVRLADPLLEAEPLRKAG